MTNSAQTKARRGDAGRDTDIAERLDQNPRDKDAKLDHGLDESMDASDPPAVTQPGKGKDPAPSSGYNAEEERQRSK